MRIILYVASRTIRSFVRQSLAGDSGEFDVVEADPARPGSVPPLLAEGCVLVVSGSHEMELLDEVLVLKREFGSSFSCVFLSADESMRQHARSARMDRFIHLPAGRDAVRDAIVHARRRRILHIDDSALIHRQVTPVLKEHGFEVLEALDGATGVEMARRDLPDMIITDLEMPGMDGYEVCRRIKDDPATEHIHVLMVTSHREVRDIRQAFEVGADDFLSKPILLPELLTRLAAVFEGSRIVREERVLIATGNRQVANLLKTALYEQGLSVSVVATAQEAIEAFSSETPDHARKACTDAGPARAVLPGCEPPALLILDEELSGGDYVELLIELRVRRKMENLPVLLVMSYSSQASASLAPFLKDAGVLSKPFTSDQALVLVERFLAERRLRKEQDAIKRFVSTAAVRAVEAGTADRPPEKRFVTVLFLDMVSFTSTVERLEPSRTVELLNQLFDAATGAVQANAGIVDKYIGDAVMAYFDGDDHEESALAALRTGHAIIEGLKTRNEAGDLTIKIRVGVNSGYVVQGSFGSTRLRKDYTIIGDTVNTASRLESAAPAMSVLVGNATFELLRKRAAFDFFGELMLKGKKAPVKAYLSRTAV